MNNIHILSSQGLNPGKAIGEIKKMLATYQGKQAATAWVKILSTKLV